jgi:hypothetical protein
MFNQFFNILKIYLNTKVIYEIDNFYTSYTKLYHPNYLKLYFLIFQNFKLHIQFQNHH